MFYISVFHSVYQRFSHFISLFLIFHISYFVSVVLIIYVSDSLSTYQFLVLYINFFYTSVSVSHTIYHSFPQLVLVLLILHQALLLYIRVVHISILS